VLGAWTCLDKLCVRPAAASDAARGLRVGMAAPPTPSAAFTGVLLCLRLARKVGLEGDKLRLRLLPLPPPQAPSPPPPPPAPPAPEPLLQRLGLSRLEEKALPLLCPSFALSSSGCAGGGGVHKQAACKGSVGCAPDKSHQSVCDACCLLLSAANRAACHTHPPTHTHTHTQNIMHTHTNKNPSPP
jgi:hypothetical protein